MSLNAEPSSANSSRPRTGTRSLSRPARDRRAPPRRACAASARSTGPRSRRRARRAPSERSSPSSRRLREVEFAASISDCGLRTAKRTLGRSQTAGATSVRKRSSPIVIVFVWPAPTCIVPATSVGDDATMRSSRTITSASAGAEPERERRISTSVPSNGTATVTVPTRPCRVTTATCASPRTPAALPTLKPSIAAHGDVARRLQPVVDGRQVAALELPLEGRDARERRSPRAGRRRLAPGRRRATARSPAWRRASTFLRLALPRHARESPEGGGHRQEREQQEVDEELDLEATHRDSPHRRRCSSPGSLLPIPHSSDVVGTRGSEHEGDRTGFWQRSCWPARWGEWQCSHGTLGRVPEPIPVRLAAPPPQHLTAPGAVHAPLLVTAPARRPRPTAPASPRRRRAPAAPPADAAPPAAAAAARPRPACADPEASSAPRDSAGAPPVAPPAATPTPEPARVLAAVSAHPASHAARRPAGNADARARTGAGPRLRAREARERRARLHERLVHASTPAATQPRAGRATPVRSCTGPS